MAKLLAFIFVTLLVVALVYAEDKKEDLEPAAGHHHGHGHHGGGGGGLGVGQGGGLGAGDGHITTLATNSRLDGAGIKSAPTD
ncbi:hypothetical protein Ocin01_08531 [Orchesella cincta]|uniref:Uncharacterized protein n=1 Tax=Orchesella cincta TaxID=48709 RepID=A0A1D2MYK7_ORCCI|nr:hypothetical protein Ocin01_08531 [Orchesella cincta]